jgi:hypothetical protein
VPAEAGGQGPVVAPVAEGNVARETETQASGAAEADGNASVAAETQELQAKAQKADN